MKKAFLIIMSIAVLLIAATPAIAAAADEVHRTNNDNIIAVVEMPNSNITELPKAATVNVLEEGEGVYKLTVELDIFEGMTDVEMLAKFLQYESGEVYERFMLAQIVVDILNSPEHNVDYLSEVLGNPRYFYINEEFWAYLGDEIEEENLEIARTVLEISKTNKDQTEYEMYFSGYVVDWDPHTYSILFGDKEFIRTENYYFVK